MKKPKKGTDWRPKNYGKCKWQAGRLWSPGDEQAYFSYFKPQIEKVASKMVRDYRLPDTCHDDLISDGMYALVKVPPENRWSGPYVYRAVINKMRDRLASSKTRWSRFELWADIPEEHHPEAPDGIVDRLTLKHLVSALEGDESVAVQLFLAGHDEKAIAVHFKIELKAAKVLVARAVASMRTQARINPCQSQE